MSKRQKFEQNAEQLGGAGQGTEQLGGGAGQDTAGQLGGAGKDTVQLGGAGQDTAGQLGGAGKDTVQLGGAGQGTEQLGGGAGQDTAGQLGGGARQDTAGQLGGAGQDTVQLGGARQILAKYLEADEEINDKLVEVSHLRQRLNISAAAFKAERVQGGKSGGFSEIIDKIVDMEKEVNQDIDRLRRIKKQIADMINGISDHKIRRVIYRRYILGETWMAISKALDTDTRWAQRLHNRGILEMERG